jgi:hypothetical protein
MTPAQQKAYYAKNKADAKVKEDKAVYELMGSRGDAARKGMEEGRMDAMGTAYKKGGKVMKKKMKRYEEGGDIESTQGQNKSIGDDVRARAMAAMEKGSSDEPAVPKKTAAKLTPKAEAPTPKEEPKAEKVNPVQQAKDVISGKDVKAPKLYDPLAKYEQAGPKRPEATPKPAPKPAPAARANSEKTGFELKKEKAMGMKAGGKVKSASARADGCAIRGKTRA